MMRYLQLARLPQVVVAAWPFIRELKELHARALKPLRAEPDAEARILAEAALIVAEQQTALVPALRVLDRLKVAGEGQKPARKAASVFRRSPQEPGVTVKKRGTSVTLEFSDAMAEAPLPASLDLFLTQRFGKR